jgi:hypothetical protein
MRKGPYVQSPFSTCDKRDALTLTTHLESPKIHWNLKLWWTPFQADPWFFQSHTIRVPTDNQSPHCIFLSPIPSCGLIFGPVSLVHVGNFRNKRVIRVGVSQKWAYRQQDLPPTTIHLLLPRLCKKTEIVLNFRVSPYINATVLSSVNICKFLQICKFSSVFAKLLW